ncbi:MAG TPA: APC family permease [Mycobacterium sp.]|jgi:amino acid transporter|nr:APC family permease [Mycobacterium sp.]
MTAAPTVKSGVPTTTGIFTRASSGLVRQVRTDDVMFYGWQQIALGYIIFIVAAWQFYPGASMELATLIATVAGLFIAGCYALLSMVYPRSGGDYVFMSRILHPVVGIVLSMSLVFWQLFYTGVNGAFLAKFGIAPMISSLGVQEHNTGLIAAGNWFSGRWGLFLGGVLVIGFFSIVQYRGAGVYFKIQRWASYITVVSLLVTFVTLILASTGVLDFHHNFDAAAGAGAYDNVIKTAGDTHHPFSLSQSLFYAAWPAFSLWFAVLSVSFAGEVKDGQRSQLRGMTLAIVTMGVAMTLLMFLYRMAFGSAFMLASTEVTPDQFPLKASPYVNLYTGIAGGNPVLTVINSLWVLSLLFFVGASSMIVATRSMLAWSLDGIAPKWMSSVSAKFHSPTWALALSGAIAFVWVCLYAFTSSILVLGGFLGQCIPFMGVCLAAIVFPFRRKREFESSPIAYRWGKVPVISVIGVVALVCVVFVFYRLLVDAAYGANNHLSEVMTIAVTVFALTWYAAFRVYRARQGADLTGQFSEIPVE